MKVDRDYSPDEYAWEDLRTRGWAIAYPDEFALIYMNGKEAGMFCDARYDDLLEYCAGESHPQGVLTKVLHALGENHPFYVDICDGFWAWNDAQVAARWAPRRSRPESDEFLKSFEWRRVRMIVIERDGAKCACCGRTAADGIKINVDHIQSRKKRPDLALDPKNLQVLCDECNHGKGNRFSTDWRKAGARC